MAGEAHAVRACCARCPSSAITHVCTNDELVFTHYAQVFLPRRYFFVAFRNQTSVCRHQLPPTGQDRKTSPRPCRNRKRPDRNCRGHRGCNRLESFSYGKLNQGESPKVDGDTLFEIGSISKVFTGLLLELMIERGDMRLDDPISKFLPASVKTPTTGGKEITLRNLVTHTAALPLSPSNVARRPGGDYLADYTDEKLYAMLSNYTPPHEIGKRFEYSSVGFTLLGHLISLKAGTNYETLLVSQICEPP